MNIADSIQKARENGLSDEKILDEIVKQNPQKKEFFEKAKERGATSAQILDEMVSQNKKEDVSRHKRTPPPPAPFPEKDIPEIPKDIPQKPTEESKLWIRIFITLGIITITSFSLTILYRTFFIPRLEPINPQIIEKEVYVPRAKPPLIMLYPEKDDVQRFAISVEEEYLMNLRRIVREESGGELVRLIVEDQREERNPRIATLRDFFSAFEINFPESFFEKVNEEMTLLVYTKESPSSIGFVVPFDSETREDVEWTIMRPWEETIEEDFLNFFNFWGENIPVTDEDLRSEDYYGDRSKSNSIRYRESDGTIGIYYSLMDDSLIFATSEDAIKEIIDRYYNLKDF